MEEVNSVALSSSGELKLNPLISFVSWKRIGKEERKEKKEVETNVSTSCVEGNPPSIVWTIISHLLV